MERNAVCIQKTNFSFDSEKLMGKLIQLNTESISDFGIKTLLIIGIWSVLNDYSWTNQVIFVFIHFNVSFLLQFNVKFINKIY